MVDSFIYYVRNIDNRAYWLSPIRCGDALFTSFNTRVELFFVC